MNEYNTPMQQLKSKLIEVISSMTDTAGNPYDAGYREALSNVVKDIDAQMLVIEMECHHPYSAVIGEEHGSPKCLACGALVG